jgi:predicted nicotinamide N-methyase
VTEEIHLAGRPYTFTRIADPNRVLDEVAAEEDRLEKVRGIRAKSDQLHLPYWAELWDSALGMSQLLIKRFSSNGTACRVLDLGCGMGLTGTVASSLGLPVLFADLESPALLFAKLNSLRHANAARTRQLNWQTARLEDRFDLILGADILYERKQWDHLEPFWRHHLAPDGSVLLGEPGRQTGDDFPAWITQRGWHVTYHHEPVETRSKPIRLFELQLRDRT